MELRPILLSLKRNKFMAFMLIVQIALTMTVLASSVLTATTTLAEWNLPSGVPQDKVIRISAEFYDENQDVGAAMQRDIERLTQAQNVAAVARTNAVPFAAENTTSVFSSADEKAEPFTTVVFESDINFFDVLQLKVLDGRAFQATDEVIANANESLTASSVMLSEDMAKVLFGNESAVGKTIWLNRSSSPVQVVGVYSNFMVGERLNGRGMSYRSIIRPQVIWQQNQEPEYLIRMNGDNVQNQIEAISDVFYKEQGRYVSTAELLARTQKRMYDGRGSTALTFLVISVVLVFITAFGISGLTSFQVNQRRKQIGTRRALGARKSDITRYFLTENAIVTLTGLIIGFVLTLLLTFQVSRQDGQNYLNIGIVFVIALGMWGISALSTWLPARRASSISPAIVTRDG